MHGIIVGLVEAFQNRILTVVEDLYDPGTARLFLVLIERERLVKLSESKRRDAAPTPKDIHAKALAEVEKVIDAIEKEGDNKRPAIVVDNSAPVLVQTAKPSWEEIHQVRVGL